MEVGQSPDLFWRLTLREIRVVLDGAAARLRREHNDRAWAVWHAAYLTAYAPEKPKKFLKLKALLFGEKSSDEAKRRDWRQDFAAFSAWAGKNKV